jgi:feruloyl-CoA synthase
MLSPARLGRTRRRRTALINDEVERENEMELRGLLTSVARKFPHKEALVAGDERYTYLELLEASRRAAAVFRDCGVAPGERVAVMTYNTPGFVLAAFGLWHAGATLVPVNHKLTAHELSYIAEHSGIRIGVVAASLLATAHEAAPNVRWLVTGNVPDIVDAESFDALVAAAAPWEGVDVDENDIGQVLYTSGTTSRPKGCLHTHRSLATVPLYTTPTVGLRRGAARAAAQPVRQGNQARAALRTDCFLAEVADASQRHRVAAVQLDAEVVG